MKVETYKILYPSLILAVQYLTQGICHSRTYKVNSEYRIILLLPIYTTHPNTYLAFPNPLYPNFHTLPYRIQSYKKRMVSPNRPKSQPIKHSVSLKRLTKPPQTLRPVSLYHLDRRDKFAAQKAIIQMSEYRSSYISTSTLSTRFPSLSSVLPASSKASLTEARPWYLPSVSTRTRYRRIESESLPVSDHIIEAR
jgi:hypothetical protein